MSFHFSKRFKDNSFKLEFLSVLVKDKGGSWNFGNMLQTAFVVPLTIAILLLFIITFQTSFYFNIVGLVYEVIGFTIMLIGSKNKIRISRSDLKDDKIIEIDFISKRRLWELGIVLVIVGLFFQLLAIIQQ